ncbi:interleukin-4 receptor subunit alpha isoform X2 [Choloepus didactylus]|nr:interleukin-4 receptor subunit alpha isoform X2 [Choloepus didactylus]XP_037670693.1 interleukin-4 receptor subunit alpha isoform X2 [Choloepus didactylus]XP_037670694.1 interleukin-4 receptor subunit alpha isoform X2 [Choloepus didactylus]XP_037670695.1 interleukin-4 receptor subunit alpha isoform X2 [Choloepus didactylus]XP_037670696.1 interleukin-4 receptor subunit alpha isoform X2 [Choloepus didactylus]
MGWLHPGLVLPVSYLILVWATGSGSIRILQKPTCLSDYVNTITCEWRTSGPTDCSSEQLLFYQLVFINTENRVCVPQNKNSSVCVCNMLLDDMLYSVDVYQLQLQAGEQQLWKGSFMPFEHIKPRAPGNLTVYTNISNTLLLTWSNPYTSDDLLYNDLAYLVNISNENNPADFLIYNVTYQEPTLRLAASTLKSGVSYRAQVRAWAQNYNSTWSEWSSSVTWQNYYEPPLEQRVSLAVGTSCVFILIVCLSCYCSIIKIKKEWWDQIPNPAHSPLVAIVIQDSQVSLWGKQSRGQESTKCLHWETCLNKLLPCLLEHSKEKDEGALKAARDGPFPGPGKAAWRSVEVNKMVLWAESVSVAQCVELSEAHVESEEEEEKEEEDKGSFCPSPENTGGSFQEGRKDIAARLTESLFLDLLGGEDGGLCPPGPGESFLCTPSENVSAQVPCTQNPSAGSRVDCPQGQEQPSDPEPNPPASLTQSSANLAFGETPAVITDNSAYRSFSDLLSQSPGPGEPDSDPQLARHQGDVEAKDPSASQPSELPSLSQPELETWEQILRQSVLQHGVATAPATAPIGGYREFVCELKQGSTQDSRAVDFGPSGETGYKAFSSLLTGSAACPGISGVEASSGEGGYRPFQNLDPGCPGAPASVPIPQFTFGLSTEPPFSPQTSLPPSSNPECFGLELVVKEEDSQKPLPSLEQAVDPLGDDLGCGIVYSALTCHLCGHLKQCHGQEERGKALVASPCCGCCCGDRSPPLVSPLWAQDPLLGTGPREASLSPVSLAPLGVSEESKSSPSFQTAPSAVQSSGELPKPEAMASTGSTYMSVS